MFLFSVTGSLIWFFLMNTFYKFDGIRLRDFLLPVAKGMVIAVPFLFIQWIFYQNISPDISVVKNFFYLFFAKDGYLILGAMAVPVIVNLIKPRQSTGSPIRFLSGYFAGFLLMIALRDICTSASHNNFLDLFITPLMRVGVAAIITVFLSEAEEELGAKKILFFVISLISPIAANFFFVFRFYPLLNIYAYLLGIALFLGGNILYILKLRKRLF